MSAGGAILEGAAPREGVALGAPLHAVSWPPPPHDPRERELALVASGWEVRLFGGRKLQYFIPRGLWHLQLWHPGARVSVLTPSRLTSGLYEVFPIMGWKARAPDLDALADLVHRASPARLPDRAELFRLQRSLVDDLVRSHGATMS